MTSHPKSSARRLSGVVLLTDENRPQRWAQALGGKVLKDGGRSLIVCPGPNGEVAWATIWVDIAEPGGFGVVGLAPDDQLRDYVVGKLRLADWRPEPPRPKSNGHEPAASTDHAGPRQSPASRTRTAHREDEPAPQQWAKPFRLRDAATIPFREHLYDRAYTRRQTSVTVGRPGAGKTSLLLAEAAAMVSGKPLLGVQPVGRLRVWYFNGEDGRDESDRQLHALAMHYGLTSADLEGWLFTGSGREAELVIARQQLGEGVVIFAPIKAALVGMIRDLKLDVVSLDPFVSTHAIPENDNGAIDRVAKEWGRIAEETNAAVMLAHHPRKAGVEDITVEDMRGGSALAGAARYVRVLNPMGKEDAERFGVERPAGYFKADDGKASFFARGRGASWFQMVSVNLGNGGPRGGDDVAVVTAWEPANPLQGVTAQHLFAVQQRIHGEGCWRASNQAQGWAGQVVAEVLGLKIGDKRERKQVAAILARWEHEGLFGREFRKDPKDYKDRPYLVVQRWVSL